MNKFDQLVDDLITGELNPTHIRMAYKAYIKYRKDIPDEIKDLLCGGKQGKSTSDGLIDKTFNLMSNIIGWVEIAYKRGKGTQYDI